MWKLSAFERFLGRAEERLNFQEESIQIIGLKIKDQFSCRGRQGISRAMPDARARLAQ
jgi:hypothetical protein